MDVQCLMYDLKKLRVSLIKHGTIKHCAFGIVHRTFFRMANSISLIDQLMCFFDNAHYKYTLHMPHIFYLA